VSRIILTALRKAGRPMTAQELAQHVMVDRGLEATDKRLLRTMVKRAGACLRNHRAAGVARSEKGASGMRVWMIG